MANIIDYYKTQLTNKFLNEKNCAENDLNIIINSTTLLSEERLDFLSKKLKEIAILDLVLFGDTLSNTSGLINKYFRMEQQPQPQQIQNQQKMQNGSHVE